MILHDTTPLIRDWCLSCCRYTPHDNGSILTDRHAPVMVTRCRVCLRERTWF